MMRRPENRTRQWLSRLAIAGLALTTLAALPGRSAAEGEAAAAEVAFTYGVRAFNHGDWEEAVKRFREAVEADPGNGELRAWLERAQALFDSRAEGSTEIPVYRGEAISLRSLPRWEARFGVAAGSDSNPAQVADGTVFGVGGGIFQGPSSDTVVNLDLRAEVHPFYDRGGWSLGLGFDGRLGLIQDLSDLDFTRLRGVVQLARGGDPLGYLVGPLGFTRVPRERRPFSLLLQAAYSDHLLDGNGFRTDGEVAVALTFREGKSTASRLDLSYRDEDYDVDGTGAFELSGEVTSARLSQTFYFRRRNAYLRVSAAAGDRAAGAAFDSTSREGAVELSLPTGPRAVFYFLGSAGRTDFDGLESNPLFPSFLADRAREDETLRATAALTYALRPSLWLTFRGSWIDRQSDLGAAGGFVDLDYDRTVATVGIRWFTQGGGAR